MNVFDLQVFNFINGFANHSKNIDSLGIFFADYLAYILAIYLLLVLFWPKGNTAKNRAMALLGLVAGLIARFVVKTIILLFYLRPRPYMVLPYAHKLIFTITSDNFQSFPSGHAIFFFALSAVIYRFNRGLGAFFFACSIIMGIARVFVGVHWPSDIIGGMVLGVLVGMGINWLYAKNQDSIDAFIAKMFRGVDKVYDRF